MTLIDHIKGAKQCVNALFSLLIDHLFLLIALGQATKGL
jgi:hypothetical protein